MAATRSGPWYRRPPRRSSTSLVLSLALAAAPRLAAASDPCEPWLAELAELTAARGYVLTASPGALGGHDGAQNLVDAICGPDGATLHFAAPDTSRINIEWSADGLELRGDFAGAGHVVQRWSGRSAEQRIVHSADTGVVAASVELDVAAADWIAEGDPAAVNAWFEPVLTASSIWRDAYFVLHALTGVWDVGLERDEAALEIALGLAVPPVEALDVDKGGVKKDCGATIGICAVAYFWKPLTGACVAAGAKCLAAFKCWKSDCSGDG